MDQKCVLLFVAGIILSLTMSAEAGVTITVGIPPEAATMAFKKVDSWFSCSAYDGYAACFHGDTGRDRRDREVESYCSNANIWNYSPNFGGTCHCFKCK